MPTAQACIRVMVVSCAVRLTVVPLQPAAAQTCTTPTNGMVIAQDTTLCGGTYYLPDGITIGAAGVTLDGGGAELVGNDTGTGLAASAHNGLTVRNLQIRGYDYGMRFSGCDTLTVESCAVAQTKELPEGDVFLDVFDGPTGNYGYAIWLRYCNDAAIRDNDVRDQQNGIGLFDCSQAQVEGNDASDNTGWGIALYNTSDSTVEDNVADDCTRLYGDWSGADAAALLMVAGSSRNQVLNNQFRRGGDGVFLKGSRENVDLRPCNDNHFSGNDCSDSPNNGFEATFSSGNVFEDNTADRCNFGWWLGYSWNSEVRNNQASDNRTAAVAIEHGYDNVIRDNTFRGNDVGIWLWTDDDPSLIEAFPNNDDSHGYLVDGNTLEDNRYGLYCGAEAVDRPDLASFDYSVTGNTFRSNETGLKFVRTRSSLIQGNVFEDNSTAGVHLQGSSGNTLYNNRFDNSTNALDDDANTWSVTPVADTNIVGGGMIGGNYWSNYTGQDTDGDGLGDTGLPFTDGGRITSGGDQAPLIAPEDGSDDDNANANANDNANDNSDDGDLGAPSILVEGPGEVAAGESVQYTARVEYADGSTVTPDTGVTWQVLDASMPIEDNVTSYAATITSAGLLTARSDLTETTQVNVCARYTTGGLTIRGSIPVTLGAGTGTSGGASGGGRRTGSCGAGMILPLLGCALAMAIASASRKRDR